MQQLLCAAQSDSLVNKYLGIQRDAWVTSNPILYKDKIVFFSNSDRAEPFGQIYMHMVDTCGNNYKTIRVEGVDNLGSGWYSTLRAKTTKDGNIMLSGDTFIDNDSIGPVIVKLTIEGKVLFKTKKPLFEIPTKLYPYDFAETPDGIVIVGYYVIGSTPPFLLSGAYAKFDKEGNMLWHDDYSSPWGHIPVSIETFDTTTNFRIYSVKAFTPQPTINTYAWSLLDKDGNTLKVQFPPNDVLEKGHQLICRVGNRIVMIGQSTEVTPLTDGIVHILDDSLRTIKKYVFAADTLNGVDKYRALDIASTNDNGFIVTMINYYQGIKGYKTVNEIYKFDENNNLAWKYKEQYVETIGRIVMENTTNSTYCILETNKDDTLRNKQYDLTKLNISGKGADICKLITTKDSKNNQMRQYQIFPNPSSDYFTISTLLESGIDEKGNLNIYDALGEVVFSNQNCVFPFYLDTINWQKGMYFIEISNQENKKKQILKWIKI